MKTLEAYLMDLWRDLAGLPPVEDSIWEFLQETQWSPRFERLMRNRLIMGCLRYEPFSAKREHFEYDCASEAIKRILLYQQDGNKEHLVDAGNMCLLQFEFGPGEFRPQDDGVHAKKVSRA